MKRLFCILALFSSLSAFANDGAFMARGNQLIPIKESNISVSKEVLYIQKVDDKINVSVRYEFFNPGNEKTILMGFEAPAPSENGMPAEIVHEQIYKSHPCIHNFNVTVNDEWLEYKVAHVSNDLFINRQEEYEPVKYGSTIPDMSFNAFQTKYKENEEMDVPFTYVYSFEAKFKKGANLVCHNYSFDLSHSVENFFWFDYILSAANRWAGGKIGSFTLLIDMGDVKDFSIMKGFFSSPSEWSFDGKMTAQPSDALYSADWMNVTLNSGMMTFHKDNFRPMKELNICRFRPTSPGGYEDMEYGYLSDIEMDLGTLLGCTKEELRMMRNAIFAHHGFVFKSADLKEHFEKEDWYKPNPSFSEKEFNKIEKKNLELIKKVEKLIQ